MRKKSFAIIFAFLTILLASSCIVAVSAVTYTYGTNESAVGVANFTIGYPVHVDPYTNNPAVTHVKVIWTAPNGTAVYTDTSTSPPTFDGTYYHFSVPDHTPTVGGNWWIYTYFYNGDGVQVGYEVQDAQLPIPLVPVPELPIIGTAGGAVICFFAVFAYIRKMKYQKLS